MPPAIRHLAFDAAGLRGFPRLTCSRREATLARMKTARLPTESMLLDAAATYYVYPNAWAGPD
jgi:hypothetical protein